MATKNLFLHSPSAGDIDEIYKEGAESISRLSLPSFPGVHSRNASNPPSTGSGFESAVSRVLKHEGGFTASDGNTGAPANFGINQRHNPDVDVRNITPDDAKSIYRQRYWNAIDGDNLPPELQGTALDAAVNQGPANARKWLAQSGGDVQKFNALRRQHYEALAARPEYAKYRKTWLNRLADYEADAQGGNIAGRGIDPASLQAQLDQEEPGRYRVLSEDEARRLSLQQELDAQEPGRFKVLTEDDLANMPELSTVEAPDIPEAESPLAQPGFWERLPQVAKSGWESMSRALDVSRAVLSDDFTPQTVDLISGAIEQQIKQAEADKSRQHDSERELKEAIEQFGKTEGAWDTTTGLFSLLGTVFSNPKGVAIGSVEQIANMLPSMGGALGGAATGAGVGAAAGSVVPGIGTGAGAAAGALWGSRAGLAAGTAALEFGHEITEAITSRLEEQGKQPTKENITALLSDPGVQSEIKTQAAKKGLTLAAVDALTMGIAGRVGSKGIQAARSGDRGGAMRYGAGAVGIEAAGEPIGEAASQLVARGEIDKADVAAEAIYGVPASVGGAAIGTGFQALRDQSGGTTTPPPGSVPPGAEPSGATPQQPGGPTTPPAAPAAAAQPAQPSGPLTRAMERAAGAAPEAQPAPVEDEAQPAPADLPRVRITAENGEAMTGVAESLAEDGTARVVGDDGQVYVIGPDDGVTIEPIVDEAHAASPEVAAPETDVGNPVSEQDQALTEPEPVAPPPVEVAEVAAPEDRPLTEYSDAELRDQLRAITQQTKLQGMTDELREIRRVISAEIDRRNQERANERGSAADPVPVPDDRLAGGQPIAQDRADQPAGTQDAQAIPGWSPAGRAEANAAPVGEGVFDAGTAADTQPALITRTDGTPFKSEAAARQAMRNRRLSGYRPVQVDGGWALEEAPQQEKPLAGEGLTSYRYRGPYGYVMIGARDHQDALNEARRSLTEGDATIDNLQVWDGEQYVDVTGPESGDARPQAGMAKPAVEIAGRLKVSPDRIAKPKHRELLSDAQDGDIVAKDDVRAQFDAGEGVFGDGLHIPTEEQIADQINALKVARMGKNNEQKAIPKYEKEVSDLIDEAIELAAIGRTLSRIGTRKARQAPAGDSTAGRNHNTVAGEYSNSVAAKLREAAESAAFLEALKRRNPPAKQGAKPEQPKQEKASEPHPLVGKTVRFVAWEDEKTGVVTGASDGTVVVRGQGGLHSVEIDRVEVIEEAEARSDKAELTPDDLDRIPFPLAAGYRIVSRPGKNSVVIAPRKIGALYMDDDFKKLAVYGKPFGFTVIRHGAKKGYANVIGPPTRPYDWMGAFLSDGGVAEAARKQREQEEAEAKRNEDAQREEEYRNLPSSKWIDENLGTEFTNLHNRLMLARVLDGVDKKFRGLIDRFWLSPLESIGFDPDQHGSYDADVIAFLKRKYAEQTKPKQEKAKPQVSKNTIFTDEAAERARTVLRSKLNQLNAGIDPEVLQAGITLAGWHLERGARAFADYARAMIEDMGEGVRPYLKSWYLGAKFDPRTAGMEGLSTAAEVEAFDVDSLDSTQDTQSSTQSEPAQDADIETVVTPSGTRFDVEYKVVDASDLITSHLDDGRVNPDFPQELQPRDRDRSKSELQIVEISANMEPSWLGRSATTTDGAPIVSPEGFVESGNGRTLAVKRVYERGMKGAQTYRDWLESQGYDVSGMRQPILIRERITPLSQQELIDYTRRSNVPTTMQMSPEEVARMDADVIPDIIHLFTAGDIANVANQDFVRAFIRQAVAPSQQGDMMTDGGRLSVNGRKRLEAALMQAAYGNDRLVEDIFVDPSAEIKTIGGAMLDAAAQWVKMRRNADPGLDVTPQLVGAVNIVRRAREEDKSVYDVANQIDVFSGATDPVTMDFLSMFFRGDRFNRQRSREAIGDMLHGYAASAEQIQPGPDMFGMEPPGAQDILRTIYEKRQREEATGQQGDIFATRTPSDDGGVAGGGRAGQGPGAQAQDAAPQESGGPVNVPSTSESVERDSGDGTSSESVVQDPDGNAGRADAEGSGRAGQGSGQAGSIGLGDQRVPGARAASGRARGNQPVHKPDGEFRPESRPSGDPEPAGSGSDSGQGSTVERERQNAVEADAHAPGADDLAQRLAAQRKAKNTPTKWGNKASIDAALPLLLPEQRDDVLKAENRLANNNGILFTNGTGTGKTATGLGVAKRFINDGKDNIIIVVPSDKIAADWVKFARMLGVNLKQLEDTKSNGDTGPVVTTYANFGQNETLAQRDWDLVIADESHYLSSNESGDATDALNQLRALTGHHKGFDHWVRQRFPKEWGAYRDAMKARSDANSNLDIGPDRYAMLEAAEVRAREKWAPIEARERQKWEDRWAKQDNLPKTVMLSATPFAYAKNTDYAEGYLFHYIEPANLRRDENRGGGYNSGTPRDRFMMQHFGYRMRYNKLTAPEAGVNSELMEQQFNEWLKQQGALSGRRLEVPFDYDRKFVMVDDAVGTKIDEALKFLREAEDGRYREIYDAVMRQFDYQRRMYLLESMKARAAVPIIREHLNAGRKVVVFHDFNKGGGFDPFREAIGEIADQETRTLAREVLGRPMFKIDFSGLASPIETMRAAFPDALFFNGTVPKGQRRQNADLFNDDDSGRNLIVVQSDAGREGVSLHDTTGKHQRVEINLGMPVKPVAATQIEGRIYRTGQASDAIFRYLTTGTAWEASAFASKIAERASTAENLALGSDARGLKEAFIDAYMNAGEFPAGPQDGKGGKEYDRKLSAALTASPFERAKTFYWAQAKNTKRRDQREGVDYFATPEPVGFKMVEWAGIQPNDKVLEPSAGHGAIARFFPDTADVTMVEPSYELSQRAGLANGNARIVNDKFESLHITNKYDAIVMNPPYGHGGKTAIEHLAKAAKHLRNGGRIVALIPRGGMADNRLNDFLESEDAANLYRVASVDLPSATFERAGTSVNTRIVVLERQDNPADAERINDRWIDLSGAKSINELFDRIEDVSMPERTAPATPEPRQDLVEHITAKGKRLTGIIRTDLTQAEAKEIDPYTFRKKNAEGQTGWFIRSKHLGEGARFSIAPGVDRNQQIPVASTPLFDVEPQSLFSAAREWYRDNLLGTSVENSSLGAPVHFSHRGQSKALSIGRRNPIRMSIVQALPDLVRNAVVIEEAADRKGRDFIDGYATLVAPVEIDGNTYAVSMKVRRAHGREIFYTLQGFNIEGSSDGGVWQLTPTGDSHSTVALQGDGDASAVSMPGAAAAPSSDTGITVGQLIDSINEANRAFSVLDSGYPDSNINELQGDDKGIDGGSVGNSLRSGKIGQVASALMDSGRVVLHDTASSVPVRNMPVGVQAVTAPDGTIHLVADALTPQSAQSVLLHEAFHQGAEKLIGTKAWNDLLKRLGSIHRQAMRSGGRAREFYDAASQSVDRARRAGVPMNEELTAEEFGAYTIEHYDQAPAAFRKWVDDVIGEIKAWLLRRFGIQAGAVTPAQLRALAVAALRNEAAPTGGARFSVAPPTNSPAFRRWFGESKVVDENGEPKIVYHGSRGEINEFQIPAFFTSDRDGAEWYSADRSGGDGGSITTAYLAIQNPLDSRSAKGTQEFVRLAKEAGVEIEGDVMEGTFYAPAIAEHSDYDGSNFIDLIYIPAVRSRLMDHGYDGVVLYDLLESSEIETWIAFRPEQIKSATDNVGTFDPANPDIRYSLKPSKHFKDLTDKQKDFLDKIGPERLPQRLSDRWRQLTDNLGLRIRQAGVDRYAALLRNDQALYGEDTLEGSIASSSWVLARMSHAAGGALSAMIDHGRIYLDPKEKVIDVREGTTGLRQMFQQLGSPMEIDRFMAWVAANRARKLMAEGRENLFTKDEIEAGINLSTGRMDDGRNRGMTYAKAWKEFQQFRDDVLRIAEQSGTISTEQRELWSEEFYVPFYRVLDEDNIGGPSMSSGLSRQQAYKRLKGGKQNLNDLLENTLLNFHHLIQSALKNQAARQAVENAEALGIAHPTTETNRSKKASTFVMVDGQKQWYDIEDTLTFKALSALNSTGLNTPLMKAGRAFKRLFTNMTTITPQFMIANTLRDSLSAMATSPTSGVPFKNAVKGAAVYGNDMNRARMLASGASFSFGHVYGQSADEIKASLRGTLRNARVISDPKLIPGALLGAWRKWNRVTDFAENVNRAGIWERNQGRGKLKAAFESRDLMDFSAHGEALTVRILIDLVPFLNARIQGLDKLYRSGFKPGGKVLFGKGTKADKQAFARFAAVTGALSVLSMMLYLQNMDDEEYRKLEDWQRDTYWFFRIGEDAFFIPKPFEVGAIATLAERALEQFMDPTVAGKKFGERLGHMLTDTFALDLPQIIKPAYELSANRNTFTDRPIETIGMQNLSPSLRVTPNTSRLAEGVSRVMETVAGEAALSPVQIDHLIGAYLGQVGAGTVALADVFWRRAMGEELPARRWSEYQPIRRFYRDLGAPSPYTRYGTDFYNALKEADKAYSNIQHLLKYQEFERAEKLMDKEADNLDKRRWLNRTQRELSKINAEMRQIQMNKEMGGEEKRYQLDRLRELRNMITEEVVKELEQERVRKRGQQ